MTDTPKKIVDNGNLCYICSKMVDKKENKIRIFGTRSADIVETVLLAIEVDLESYSSNTRLFICKSDCYSRIMKLKHSLDKVNALKKELKTVYFNKTAGHRFKRMLPVDGNSCNTAVGVNNFGADTETGQALYKKRVVQRLEFANMPDNENSCPTETISQNCRSTVQAAGVETLPPPKFCQQQELSLHNFVSGLIYPRQNRKVLHQAFPCHTGGFLSNYNRSPIAAQVVQKTTLFTASNSEVSNCQNNAKTSTPISSHRAQNNGGNTLNSTGSNTGDYVKVTVRYPSKEVNKILNQCYVPLGKSLADGSPSRIAKAIMNCEPLRISVIEKVLNLVSLETTALCSRNHPSLLKKTTKEDLINFDLQCLCKEWQEKAPVFYSFLLACCESNRRKAAVSWFGSVAIAGSILLKQRDPSMSATSIVMAILLKTRSIEVCFFHIL